MNSSTEARLIVLEMLIQRLMKDLASVKDKVGQVSEDVPRQQDQDAYAGDIFFHVQSVGVIPGGVPPDLGVGTVRFLQVIGNRRYKLQPIALGDITGEAVNATGSPTINNEYLVAAYVAGRLTLFLGDCITLAPVIAPDPPA